MRWIVGLWLCLFVLSSCGCKLTTQGGVISPVARIVPAGEAKDFGFVEKWRRAPDPVSGHPDRLPRDENPPIVITMQEDGTHSVVAPYEDAKITCRAVSLPEPGFALVEVEALRAGEPKPVRLLVVAKREGESLFFRYLFTTRLAASMAADGKKVSIEQGVLCSAVDANPAELLACVREHWSELAGEPTTHWIREER